MYKNSRADLGYALITLKCESKVVECIKIGEWTLDAQQ